MQDKYRQICQILNLPTHGIHITNNIDECGVPEHMPYELSDASALLNIIRALDDELTKARGIGRHIFKVGYEDAETIKRRFIEAASEDQVRKELEARGCSKISISKVQ